MADTLTLRDLSVTLADKAVLYEIDCQIPAGQLLGILGPNGAGKTTLLKAIAGLVKYQGQIQYGEQQLGDLSPKQHARTVAYVPQRSLLSTPLAAASVVAQGRYCHGSDLAALSAKDREAIAAAMHTAQVTHLADAVFTELSGGEQRLVLLARALATEAPVILLDEPAASLDIAHSLTLFHHLQSLQRAGRTLVVVLHELNDAATWCNSLLLLAAGRIVARGEPKQVITKERVREVYGVELGEQSSFGFSLMEQRP